MHRVLTVTGTVGGIGTSSLAWALALCASPPVLLIDAQSHGVPLDVLLGAEAVDGVRWSQVRIRSAAFRTHDVLATLPSHHGVALLSADAEASADARALELLVARMREEATVVVDLPARHPSRPALQAGLDLVLLPPTVPGIGGLRHARRAGSALAVIDTGMPDVSRTDLTAALGAEPAWLRWQGVVRTACLSGAALPAGCDLMRFASRTLAEAPRG